MNKLPIYEISPDGRARYKHYWVNFLQSFDEDNILNRLEKNNIRFIEYEDSDTYPELGFKTEEDMTYFILRYS